MGCINLMSILVEKEKGPWLDVKSTAHYLALTERAVRDLEYRGILPGHRLGRSLKFSLQELDELLVKFRQPTLYELGSREVQIPPGPLGPLMSPEAAAEYLGLPSVAALIKRTQRLQIPAYRISERIIRYRAAELDQAFSENRLTPNTGSSILNGDACLPERKEVNVI